MSSQMVLDDGEATQPTDTRFIASDWRGCNRLYKDLPTYVAFEIARARDVPANILKTTLPSNLLSPAGIVANSKLPSFNRRDDRADDCGELTFDDAEPNFLPTSSLDIALPSYKTMQRLNRDYGQAWLDNKQSIRDERVQPARYLPLWFVAYFLRVRGLAAAGKQWEDAAYYLYAEVEKVEATEAVWQTRTMDALVSISGWHGHVPGPQSAFMFENLADILGEHWLTESIVDGLVADVRRRANLLTPEPQDKLHCIADLDFTHYIEAYAGKTLERRGAADLERYADLICSSVAPRFLVFPLYSPPYHWTAGAVDFEQKTVRFGDSLGRAPPAAFVSALAKWLRDVKGWMAVKVKTDLPCGRQQDGFNCGIIAANTIAHLVLGDEIWQQRNARAHRFRAFCILGERILCIQGELQELLSTFLRVMHSVLSTRILLHVRDVERARRRVIEERRTSGVVSGTGMIFAAPALNETEMDEYGDLEQDGMSKRPRGRRI